MENSCSRMKPAAMKKFSTSHSSPLPPSEPGAPKSEPKMGSDFTKRNSRKIRRCLNIVDYQLPISSKALVNSVRYASDAHLHIDVTVCLTQFVLQKSGSSL
ncbi:unnamed protein product [Schistosoma bovis]|nr:unnamed protein product [Schistosoma bovis]